MTTIVLATPHRRHDALVEGVAKKLPGYNVVRVTRRKELVLENLGGKAPEWIFFPHWSWKIPEEIYRKFECVIFHMTDLPYGRGGSPLQNLIVRGHKKTKISAIKCVAELDAGPVYAKEPLSLDGTAEEILLRASGVIEQMIVKIVQNKPEPEPQTGEVVVFKRRRPEDGDVAVLNDLDQMYDYIRMLDAEGYPRAFLRTEHWVFEFRQADLHGECIDASVRIRRREDE